MELDNKQYQKLGPITCKKHWDELISTLKEAGIFKFVASNGYIAAERLQSQLNNTGNELENFEPLLNANFAIIGNALECGGEYLLLPKEDGSFYCPLCELESNTPEKASTWINYAVRDQVNLAIKLGLLPGIQ